MTDEATLPTPLAAVVTPPPLAVVSTRRLLATSFDLLVRTSERMRRASFSMGTTVLLTAGPFALATWGIEVASRDLTIEQLDAAMLEGAGGWFGLAGIVAFIGLIVALVESRIMAAAILGAELVGRPISTRQALARSRGVFWRAVVAAIIAAIPLLIAQAVASALIAPSTGGSPDVDLVVSVVLTAVIGAPFAYVLAGVVLGDVAAFEAVRRSFRVFRARKVAAALVAVFEAFAQILVVLGLSAGLDIAIRVFDGLGLGTSAGPVGILITTIALAVGVFAVGTLLFTVAAIAVAPQVVMFVSLTWATMGLDHVRPGGDRDPDTRRPGVLPFRWVTRSMLGGAIVAAVAAILAVSFLP